MIYKTLHRKLDSATLTSLKISLNSQTGCGLPTHMYLPMEVLVALIATGSESLKTTWIRVMVFNTTLNNMSAILWR